jgi:hypothetical protein
LAVGDEIAVNVGRQLYGHLHGFIVRDRAELLSISVE